MLSSYILTFIIVILTAVFIYLNYPILFPQPPNSPESIPCNIDPNSLPDVDDIATVRFEPCKNIEGQIIRTRYYDTTKNRTLLIDTQTPPNIACSGYSGEDYDSCIQEITPSGCSDIALPVARRLNSYYYVLSAGRVGCYNI